MQPTNKVSFSMDELRLRSFDTAPEAEQQGGTVHGHQCACTNCSNCTGCSNCSACSNCTGCSICTGRSCTQLSGCNCQQCTMWQTN